MRKLAHMTGTPCLTDGGLETTLVFHEGVELPYFAAFVLMQDEGGRGRLAHYYERYLAIAAERKLGYVLESPTWRASPDWAERLGLTPAELAHLNRDAIELMHELRSAWKGRVTPIVVSGCVGPRGDGYDPGEAMTPEEARAYHAIQIGAFAAADADMVCAVTMTNVAEAVGVTRAARDSGLPVAISFTVETDGRLPTGEGLGEAIQAVDAATDAGPAYFMINCAHPSHFAKVLERGGGWLGRIGGLRANASKRSHQELNDAPELDDGDPVELAADHAALISQLPRLRVLGGCCGTDHRHVMALAETCLAIA